MDLGKYEVDLNKNENGVWISIEDGCKLLIARAGNKTYTSALRRGMEQGKKKFRNIADMPEEDQNEIVNYAIAEGILLGWVGLEYNSEELKYSKSECLKILNNPAFVTFRGMVIELASDNARFRADELEDVKENVKKS